MKMLRYPLFILCLSALTLLSCNKNKHVELFDLQLSNDTYYVSEGDQIHIRINQGNKKYQVIADNNTIINAVSDPNWDIAGQIVVSGLKKGTTKLQIKDEVSGNEVPVTVHVVDPFIVLKSGGPVPGVKAAPLTPTETIQAIRSEVLTYNVFDKGDLIILSRNMEHQFMVFSDAEAMKNADVKRSGTYSFHSNQNDELMITLKFKEEEKTVSLSLLLNSPFVKKSIDSFRSTDPTLKSASTPVSRLETKPFEYFDEYFTLIQDKTDTFTTTHNTVESVQLFEQMHLWYDFHNYGLKIGNGLLN